MHLSSSPRSGGIEKIEFTRFIIRTAAQSEIPLPKAGDEHDARLRTIIDTAFAKYDKDKTGEVEFDELNDALVTDAIKEYTNGIDYAPLGWSY
jgi:Ca2+-binding EF-hand superfamily protein